MDRREVLKALFGFGIVAAGSSVLAASDAEARITPAPPMPEQPAGDPAVATEEDLANARVENVWHRGYPHRGWYWRRRRRWWWRRRWAWRRRRWYWRRRRWWRRRWRRW